MDETLYVVKHPSKDLDMFLTLDSDGKETHFTVTSLERAMKYTKEQLKKLYLQFRQEWGKEKLEVYEVVLTEKRCFDWTS